VLDSEAKVGPVMTLRSVAMAEGVRLAQLIEVYSTAFKEPYGVVREEPALRHYPL
jgi:hypothetical protein